MKRKQEIDIAWAALMLWAIVITILVGRLWIQQRNDRRGTAQALRILDARTRQPQRGSTGGRAEGQLPSRTLEEVEE